MTPQDLQSQITLGEDSKRQFKSSLPMTKRAAFSRPL